MKRSTRRLPSVLTAFLLPALCLQPLAQEKKDDKAADEYQNRQRSLSLILYDSRIKSLDDAPMRCLARQEVVRFLVESGSGDLDPYAFAFAEACLEETLGSSGEFLPLSLGWHRAQIFNLVQKIDREKAELLEEEYPIEGFAKSLARGMELSASDDPTSVTAKVITEIRSGTIPNGTSGFVSGLKRRDPSLANAVLEAVLAHYEARLGTIAINRELLPITFQILQPDTPPALRNRFLMLYLNLGRRALADRSDPEFTRMSATLLSASVEAFEKHLPASFEEARSIVQVLQASQSEFERQTREAFERIQESDDKLAATIAEAEAAKDEKLKSTLWRSASNIALKENKLRIAIEAVSQISEEGLNGWNWFMMTEAIPRRAIQTGDTKTVEYLLERLEEPADRTQVMFIAAAEFKRKDSQPSASEYFTRGLEFLGKAGGSNQTLRQFLSAVSLSLEMSQGDAMEIARDSVAAVNRLPTPSAEDIRESDGQKEFVLEISQAAHSVTQIFQKIAEKDPDLAYTISQGIQRRDLRLMAEISVERLKKYPLPKEEEK
ncbi:MAG TPA: hypothetical protein VMM38_11585 [Aridibacter sp.]|nr:hypothetical protein [Aridibacter sp.]